MRFARGFVVVALVAVAACGGNDVPAKPLFPADYTSSYLMVYGCRDSIDHDLRHVTVWADPINGPAYRDELFPLPAGTTLVKEEFDDDGCTHLVSWTVMKKTTADVPDASVPLITNWAFQRLNTKREVIEADKQEQCVSCHESGCADRDFTCINPHL